MDKKTKIENIKTTHKDIDNFVKLHRATLYRMLPNMSIEDLKSIEDDSDVELYHAEEDYKSILSQKTKQEVKPNSSQH